MIGYADDYAEIENEGRSRSASCLSFGEWIFFAFGMEPNSDLDKALGKLIPEKWKHYRGADDNQILRQFATELLESGEHIFRMSERYRNMTNSAGGKPF